MAAICSAKMQYLTPLLCSTLAFPMTIVSAAIWPPITPSEIYSSIAHSTLHISALEPSQNWKRCALETATKRNRS